MRRMSILACAVVAMNSFAGTTYTYQGPGKGVWNQPANWSPSGIPGAGDLAKFTSEAMFEDPITLSEGMLTIDVGTHPDPKKKYYVTLAGKISGSGGIAHQGRGTLSLKGTANDFTGPVTNFAGRLECSTVANGGSPSSLGAGTGDLYIKSGEWSILDLGETDRPVHFDGTVMNNSQVRFTGPVSGYLFKRNNGELIVDSYLGKDVSEVRLTDFGVVRLNHPTNTFGGGDWIDIAAGTLAVKTLANKGEPCSAGTGNGFNINQYDWYTQGGFMFEGETNTVTDRDFVLYAYKGDTEEFHYPATIANQNPGVKLTLTGNILKGNRCGPFPMVQIEGAGDGELVQPLKENLNLRKRGVGTWILSGENEASGILQVQNGRLIVNGSTAAASDVSVCCGAVLSGTGVVHGATRALAHGIISAGDQNTCGALSFDHPTSALTFEELSFLKFKIGEGTNDVIHLTGAPKALGSVDVSCTAIGGGAIPEGTYTLMTWDSPPALNAFVLNDAMNGSLAITDKALLYTVKVTEESLFWKGDGSLNVWDTVTPNWEDGLLFSENAAVVFTDQGSADPAISISGSVAPSKIDVITETNHYVFTGGKITGSCKLSKTGKGTLTLNNDNDFTGTLTVGQGKVELGGKLSGTSLLVSELGSLVQSPASSISGENISLRIEGGEALLAGTNTFTGTVILDARQVSQPKGFSFHLQNPFSFGEASTILLYPKNQQSGWGGGSGLAFDRSIRAGEGKTLLVGKASGNVEVYLETLAVDNNNSAWLGDIRPLEGNDQEAALTLRALRYDSSLEVGKLGQTEVSGMGHIYFRGGGMHRIYSTIKIGRRTLYFDDQGVTEIYSTGNEHGGMVIRQGICRLCTNDAFSVESELQIGKNSSQWGGGHNSCLDLNGFNQTLALLREIEVGMGGTREIQSAKPATLTISGTENSSFGSSLKETSSFMTYSEIKGAISLVKAGSSVFSLDASNSFTGDVTVCGGTLAANAKNALGCGEKLVDVQGGLLSLACSGTVEESATLRIAARDGSAGQIHLAPDTVQTVQYLYEGERQLPPGTYGSPETAATRRYGCFTGTGILQVQHGISGTCVILK